MYRRLSWVLGGFVLSSFFMINLSGADLLQPGTNRKMSVGVNRSSANGDTFSTSIDSTGRYVGFNSQASNLVAEDTNDVSDIFIRDVELQITERVTQNVMGEQANAGSYGPPQITPGGRFVAFSSWAMNLVPGDTNAADVFVKDRTTGTLDRISVSTSGNPGNDDSLLPSISDNGRLVAFMSYSTNLSSGTEKGYLQIFLRDRQAGTTVLVSKTPEGGEANSHSAQPRISRDGSRIVFWSYSSDLVPGDTNGDPDVFAYEVQTGTVSRASVSPSSMEGNSVSFEPTISRDGRHISFTSLASNLAPGNNDYWNIFTKDLLTGDVLQVSTGGGGRPEISGDGQTIAYSYFGLRVWVRSTGTTSIESRTRLSRSVNAYSPGISEGGRFVTFVLPPSSADTDDTDDFYDAFWRDVEAPCELVCASSLLEPPTILGNGLESPDQRLSLFDPRTLEAMRRGQ